MANDVAIEMTHPNQNQIFGDGDNFENRYAQRNIPKLNENGETSHVTCTSGVLFSALICVASTAADHRWNSQGSAGID